MQRYSTVHGTIVTKRTEKMEIALDGRSDLSQVKIESLLRLIDTPEKRRAFLTDLCTLREYLDKMFIYEESRLKQKKTHPAYRIMVSVNEIVGSLLLNDDRLKYTPTGSGVVVEVVGVKRKKDPSPMPILKSVKEYNEYVKAMELGIC